MANLEYSVGAGHYFGDLNTKAHLNRPKIAASILFRKQFGNYIALRVQGTYASLGYSDIYSDNEVQKIRNLSFNTNIFELALMGDFNFFRFVPGQPGIHLLRLFPLVSAFLPLIHMCTWPVKNITCARSVRKARIILPYFLTVNHMVPWHFQCRLG